MCVRITILGVVVSQLFLKAETGNGQEILNLINLGQVDEKNYFYDQIEARTWTAAGKYCNDAGLQLATIETSSQADFLTSKYSSGILSTYYWTAARDAQLPRQFTWNSTGTTPTDSIGLPWSILGDGMPYQTCVVYDASRSPTLALCPCTFSVYVLCQT